jgi:YD repeat-containing protein
LASSKQPVQSNAVHYAYDADDVLLSMTDPRGVVTTYGYTNADNYTNRRHLVNSITYSNAPSGVPVPAQVRFEYDAVGNRTQMTDGTGSVAYNYNAFSQLASETRRFTGLAGSFTLAYGYTISGQLRTLSNNFTNTTVTYAYDVQGRLQAVTGSGPNSQPSYVSALRYRAWGALKDMDYGNNTHAHTDYNARLLPVGYAVSNVKPNGLDTYPYGPFPAGTQAATYAWTYDYYADGRLQHVADYGNGKYNRKYEYDHAGRLTEAYTGRAADGLPPIAEQPDPYRQSMTYNAWDNLTARTGSLYSRPLADTGAAFINDRRSDFTYDAAGAVLRDGSHVHTYDAAGQQTYVYSEGPGTSGQVGDGSAQFPYRPAMELTQTYDGAGQPVRRAQTQRANDYADTDDDGAPELVQVIEYRTTTYLLHSAVLGGQVVQALDEWQGQVGGQERIYAAGQRVYQGSYQHNYPATGGFLSTRSDHYAVRQERDPAGAEVPLFDPAPAETYVNLKWQEPLYLEAGNPFDYNAGYTVDGLPVSAAEVQRLTQSGALAIDIQIGTFLWGQVGVPSRGLGYVPSNISISRALTRHTQVSSWLAEEDEQGNLSRTYEETYAPRAYTEQLSFSLAQQGAAPLTTRA